MYGLLLLLTDGCVRYRPPGTDDSGPGTADTVDRVDTGRDSVSTPTDSTDTPPVPPRSETGLVYEVYVRSFQDSDGDGIGDLAGLRSRLGYLQELGVTVLWLMPVFPSPGVAGYEVTDYLGVDLELGSAEDLAALCAEAAALGIRVTLDIPLNHSSSDHPDFVAAVTDRSAATRDRYVFAETRYDTERWFPAAAGDFYYGYFGQDQPDFDWTTEATHTAFAEVVSAWQGAGVGGWRVDAVRQLVEADGLISDAPESHDVMAWFYDEAKRGDGFVIAEAFFTDDTEGMLPYLGTEARPEADVLLDVPRSNTAVATLAQADAGPIMATLDAEIAAGAERRMVSFFASHDTDRLPVRVQNASKRRLLEVLNFLLPGLPMLYYGDELDLANGDAQYRQDEPQRTPMPWDTSTNGGFTTGTAWFNLAPGWETTNVATAQADPDSMLSLVLALQALRTASLAVREGELTWTETTDPTRLGFRVTAGDEHVDVFANLGTETVDPPVSDDCPLVPGGRVGPYGYMITATAALCDFRVPPNL